MQVKQNGRGHFKTITEAINSVRTGNTRRVIIKIGPGVYKEKVTIDRNKPFITLYGHPNAMPVLTFDGTAAQYGTVDSATLIVLSDYFMAVNIIVKVYIYISRFICFCLKLCGLIRTVYDFLTFETKKQFYNDTFYKNGRNNICFFSEFCAYARW